MTLHDMANIHVGDATEKQRIIASLDAATEVYMFFFFVADPLSIVCFKHCHLFLCG